MKKDIANVLSVCAAIKLEKAIVGFGYNLTEIAAHGAKTEFNTINEIDKLFLDNCMTPPRRKKGNVFYLEVEMYTTGLFVFIEVNEELYSQEANRFLSALK